MRMRCSHFEMKSSGSALMHCAMCNTCIGMTLSDRKCAMLYHAMLSNKLVFRNRQVTQHMTSSEYRGGGI